MGILKIFGGICIIGIGVMIAKLDGVDPNAEYQRETVVLGETVASVPVSAEKVRAEKKKSGLITGIGFGVFGLWALVWGGKDLRD